MTGRGNTSSIATLAAIVDDAIAVTTVAPAASDIDERELLRRFEAVSSEVVAHAAERPEVIDALDQLVSELEERLKRVPQDIEDAASRYRLATLKWRPDPPALPRSITAFVVLWRLQAARASCVYERSKARYQALCKPGDRCDCAARIEAQFLSGRPNGPLDLVESSGVAFAAMDHVWRCTACGTTWHESETYDDFGAHSDWSPAPLPAARSEPSPRA